VYQVPVDLLIRAVLRNYPVMTTNNSLAAAQKEFKIKDVNLLFSKSY